MIWAQLIGRIPARYLSEVGTIATRGFSILAGLATSAITAHALVPEARGEYFYVTAMAAVLASFANLGLPSANTYFGARDLGLIPRLLWWSIIVSLISGLLVSGGFFLATLVPGLSKFKVVHEVWLFVLTPVVLGLAMLGPLLAGAHRFGALNALQIGQQALLLLAFAAIARWTPSAAAFLAAASIAGLVGMLATALVIKRGQTPQPRTPLTSRDWLFYGGRAYAMLLLGTLVSRLGVVFVRALAEPAELGIYSVSVQLWDAMSILPSSLALILFPTIVRDGTLTWEKCVSELWRMTGLAAAAAVGAAIVLKPAIPLVFGQDYASAYLPSLLFLPGFVALSMVTVASQFLAGIGLPPRMWLNWAMAAGLLAVTAPLFVTRWGGAGAAAATSLTYCLLAAAMLRFAYHTLPKDADSRHV